jgi:sec-independent protein translocase protein TatC
MALKLTEPDPENNSQSDLTRSEERKAELTEHLAELRTRLIRASIYVFVGMGIMWILSGRIQVLVMAPINNIVQHLVAKPSPEGQLPNSGFVINNFTDGFFLKLQIATVGGLILALPLALLELWGFIAPALTPQEKKGVHFVAPMSVVLFFMGTSCAYFILPMAARWFLSYIPPGAILLQNPLTWTVFVVKILLVFGLLFELPVVLMLLGKIGIINSALMIKYWRQIAVGLFTMAMVVAPSNDPGTMLALAIPLTLLFFGSIGLVKMVEPKPPQH